jgi:Flp pilus assembly protein TadB
MSQNNPDAYNISTAPVSAAEDRAHRQRVYLMSMSLRVVCFLLAVLLPAPMPIRITLIAGAILLPYFAVVVANAARRRPTPGADAQLGAYRVSRKEIN